MRASLRAFLERDRLGLLLLLAIAAALRLPGLESRGRFEFDQGQDMLVLRAFVQDGVVPLLGPKTSVAVFHHGALEYYLLAPAAWLSGAEPLGVALEFVVIGLAAVAATWWLGRVLGGRWLGLVAGLLLAVSPAAVDESIFIWNPNPVPLLAALAFGGAWRARQTGRARWWAVALACTAAVANLHVLGAVFVPPVVALLAAEVLAARRAGDAERIRRAFRGAAVGVAIGLVIYLPFIVHELQTGFGETRAIVDYVATSGGEVADPLPLRLVVTALRVVDWPFIGLITDVPAAASLVFAVVVALLAWLVVAGRGEARTAGRWIAGTLAWSIIALAVAAPSLSSVVLGLPNDHYHAFLDPLLVTGVGLAGLELARHPLARHPLARHPLATVGAAAATPTRGLRRPPAVRVLLAAALAGLVALALWRQPPPDPNGGWPAARAAGEHVVAIVGRSAGGLAARIEVLNLPVFEPPTWISYPIVHAAGDVSGGRWPLTSEPAAGDYVVLGCDRLFEIRIGAACGGPADAAWLPRLVGPLADRLNLVDRFDLSPRINVAVYRVLAD